MTALIFVSSPQVRFIAKKTSSGDYILFDLLTISINKIQKKDKCLLGHLSWSGEKFGVFSC